MKPLRSEGIVMLFAVAVAVACAMPAARAQGSVYRCTAPDGRTAYQSQPCAPGGQQREVRMAPVPESAGSAPRPSMWKGYTPERVAFMTFYYDPAEQPVGFSTEQMEGMIRSAAALWSRGCDVRIQYGGRAPRAGAGTPERVPVRWAPEYMRMAHPADARSGIAGTGSLASGIALRPRFQEQDMLGVIVHEMGHVLGLPHNHEDTRSVMSYLRDEEVRRNAQPSESDYLACNLSMKKMFGIAFKPPAGAAPEPCCWFGSYVTLPSGPTTTTFGF